MAGARGALVLASAAAGMPGPIDGVTGNLDDDTVLTSDVHYARRIGFSGKLCIHPRQVPVVTAEMRPTDVEVEWAHAIIGASAAGGVVVVNGLMVDKPVVDRARRILRQTQLPLPR
ncbi:HpcH/HpaI aldolase/citrate lyase family protein [Aldersonia sp. NBC_00410]|uniref:HpcH/HpaI aldolase/citrate lyase family protein n=1 Tax=Aldersonia sp. NBC_00410 TaxID=2975954 RepID=UPI002257CE35|nr:HpcH/HpaI aldolase/citrate lyase family protein [Aldersonia sp. NBC_00410]MCX5044072.1 HpcH/HpaI aldolase/citrate lyase family protein [Aldersonia sp. NBC_00410]